MNRKIGMYGSLSNLAGVSGFALSMILGSSFGSYLTSMLIAFGYVTMTCAFRTYHKKGYQTAGNASMLFGAMYAVIIILVYYAQTTAVRLGQLSSDALGIIDYSRFGLFFSYDLLGYCLMALSTIFAGLTIHPVCKQDKALSVLLMLHGIFTIPCFIMPMLGLFRADNAGTDLAGVILMEVWCAYFIPVGILSFLYFRRQQNAVISDDAAFN